MPSKPTPVLMQCFRSSQVRTGTRSSTESETPRSWRRELSESSSLWRCWLEEKPSTRRVHDHLSSRQRQGGGVLRATELIEGMSGGRWVKSWNQPVGRNPVYSRLRHSATLSPLPAAMPFAFGWSPPAAPLPNSKGGRERAWCQMQHHRDCVALLAGGFAIGQPNQRRSIQPENCPVLSSSVNRIPLVITSGRPPGPSPNTTSEATSPEGALAFSHLPSTPKSHRLR